MSAHHHPAWLFDQKKRLAALLERSRLVEATVRADYRAALAARDVMSLAVKRYRILSARSQRLRKQLKRERAACGMGGAA